ncbi:MAG: hypothetical protein JXQ73_20415 [Phycisphaerae bacterium]|nr:hypothetical protein [Phycisphaerae bacterium]
MKAAGHFESQRYEASREYAVQGNGTVDLLAERAGERLAVEIETGKSDVRGNLEKLQGKGFERIVFVATSPAAVSACRKVMDGVDRAKQPSVELLTWLDVS